ncbi:MAG: DUF4097 family beta strand repeat-containing protein [Bacteroidota bacterium]
MKSMFLFCLLLLGLNLSAQKGESIDVPLSQPGKRGLLIVDIKKGPIKIKGTARQDVLVRYNSLSEDDEMNETRNGLKKIASGGLNLSITEKDNIVSVDSDSWNKGVEIYVEIPMDFDLKIESYNDGDLAVENVKGELELESYNGQIEAENISGSLVASTYNGDIRVHFNTITTDASMAFSTYNGDIDLKFPTNLSAKLKMRSDAGDIYSDYDIKLNKKANRESKKDAHSGVFKVSIEKWTHGTVGSGSAEIVAKTYNGDILVQKSK